jgi:hypothetical protein
MATYEQCEQELREKFTTVESIIEFSRGYRGVRTLVPKGPDSATIEANVRDILQHAKNRDDLDGLGLKLAIPTDAEQARVKEERRHHQIKLWTAIGATAALVSCLTYFFSGPDKAPLVIEVKEKEAGAIAKLLPEERFVIKTPVVRAVDSDFACQASVDPGSAGIRVGHVAHFRGAALGGCSAFYSYTWEFTDGTAIAGQDVDKVFRQAGNHNAIFTVGDHCARRLSATLSISVKP